MSKLCREAIPLAASQWHTLASDSDPGSQSPLSIPKLQSTSTIVTVMNVYSM
jgi:hypothetical protein